MKLGFYCKSTRELRAGCAQRSVRVTCALLARGSMVSLGLGRAGEDLGRHLDGGRWEPRLGQRLQNVEEGTEGREDQEGSPVRPFGSHEEDSQLSEGRP